MTASLVQQFGKVPLSVAIIGSGNWGTTAARIVAQNAASWDHFATEVQMYVHDELVDGKPLHQVINKCHENVRYLPDIKLPVNLVASNDIVQIVRSSNMLIFVTPHQFMKATLQKIKKHVIPDTLCLSLVKGFNVIDGNLQLMSELVKDELSLECGALSGANVAVQIAEEGFSEATIACRDLSVGRVFQKLFHRPYFSIRLTRDVRGVEMCGAVKNVIAIACGIVDGLNFKSNTKAAIIRIGLQEMRQLSQELYSCVDMNTFFESCGVADLITTCFAGRNRRCAELFARTGRSFDVIEAEELNGQKLQGPLTSKEVFEVLQHHNLVMKFPLMVQTYRICYENADPSSIVSCLMSKNPRIRLSIS